MYVCTFIEPQSYCTFIYAVGHVLEPHSYCTFICAVGLVMGYKKLYFVADGAATWSGSVPPTTS